MDEAFAVIMAFSRLYAGVHYPTDVVSGIIVSFVGGFLTWHLRSTIFDRKHPSCQQNKNLDSSQFLPSF